MSGPKKEEPKKQDDLKKDDTKHAAGFCSTEPIQVVKDSDPNFASAFGIASKVWKNKPKITYRFLDKWTQKEKRKLEDFMNEWTGEEDKPILSIRFEEVHSGESDIRVMHNTHKWESLVGNDATLPEYKGTATLRLDDVMDDEENYSVNNTALLCKDWIVFCQVLHELGHVLGMQHEHQRIDVDMEFDKPKLFAYCKLKFGWEEEQTRRNVLTRFQCEDTSTEYDNSSIMHYHFPKEVLSKGECHKNTKISEKDREWVRNMYSLEGNQVANIQTFLGARFNLKESDRARLCQPLDMPSKSVSGAAAGAVGGGIQMSDSATMTADTIVATAKVDHGSMFLAPVTYNQGPGPVMYNQGPAPVMYNQGPAPVTANQRGHNNISFLGQVGKLDQHHHYHGQGPPEGPPDGPVG